MYLARMAGCQTRPARVPLPLGERRVLGIGAALLLLDAAVSWREVGSALFGRRGRYGANTVLMAVAFIAIVVVLNWLFFTWAL